MTRILPHVAAELFGQPLLVQSSYMETLLTAIHDRLEIEPIVSSSVLESNHRPTRYSYIEQAHKIAVVPIVGGLTHRSGYESASGSTGYTGLQSEVRRLVEEGAKGFVFDYDSPGGSVAGIRETSDFLTKLSAEFPTYAVANELMASAAYWLAAPSTRIYAAPLASVGSIGVTTAHIDRSEQMKRMGVVVTHISAGARKTDGSPYGPLSEDALAGIQARINGVYGAFVDHVAKNRNVDPQAVRDTEAGVFSPDYAKKLGLIDGIATLSETIDAMKTRLRSAHTYAIGSFPSTKTGASAAMAENLNFAQSDIDRAVASALSAERSSQAAAVQAAREDGAVTALTSLTSALSGLFEGDARASSFIELIQDGMEPAKAAKHAAKITATANQAPANLAATFAAAAPNVPTGATDPSAETASTVPVDASSEGKDAFLASIGLGNGRKLKSSIASGAASARI